MNTQKIVGGYPSYPDEEKYTVVCVAREPDFEQD